MFFWENVLDLICQIERPTEEEALVDFSFHPTKKDLCSAAHLPTSVKRAGSRFQNSANVIISYEVINVNTVNNSSLDV